MSQRPPPIGPRHVASFAPPSFVRDHVEPAAPRLAISMRRLSRVALRVVLVGLAVLLVGKCTLGVTDRPQWLGLSTATRGVSLRDASRVVILLHGYGASRDDLARIADEVDAPDTTFVLAEGPYRVGLGHAWWATTNPAERADAKRRVSELIDAILAKTGLPASRVFVAGFSQGAALALDVALSRPDTLGGAMAFSPCRDRLPWAQLAAGHAPMRLVIAHGRADRVCPFGPSEDLTRELVAAGHDARLFAFDGPHTVSPEGEDSLAALLRGE